jgi:hypothetical protein
MRRSARSRFLGSAPVRTAGPRLWRVVRLSVVTLAIVAGILAWCRVRERESELQAGSRDPVAPAGSVTVPNKPRPRGTTVQDDAMRIVLGYMQLAKTDGVAPETTARLHAEANKALEAVRTRGVLDIHVLEGIAAPIRDRLPPQPRRMGPRDDAMRIVLGYLLLAQTDGVTDEEAAQLNAEASKALASIRMHDVLELQPLEKFAAPIRDRLGSQAGSVHP